MYRLSLYSRSGCVLDEPREHFVYSLRWWDIVEPYCVVFELLSL